MLFHILYYLQFNTFNQLLIPNAKSFQSRDLKVLRCPFLRLLPLRFPGLRNRLTRLHLALDDQGSEPVVEQVALRFKKTQGVL